MSLVFISFITKTKQMTLVFEWLKTKLMKSNKLFGFITKTKLMALVFDWLKTKQIKTKEMNELLVKHYMVCPGCVFITLGARLLNNSITLYVALDCLF